MSAILLSIHPKHVEKILSGEKKFEYRKRTGAREVDRIIIYSARPVKMVVAEVRVLRTLVGAPEDIWLQTHKKGGVQGNFFDKYFSGKNVAIAYELGEITRYEPARPIESLGLKRGPQSFVYIADGSL